MMVLSLKKSIFHDLPGEFYLAVDDETTIGRSDRSVRRSKRGAWAEGEAVAAVALFVFPTSPPPLASRKDPP